MKNYTAAELKGVFESQATKQYEKFAPVAYRSPYPNETLVVTCGGKIETVQKVKPDQIVVMAIGVGTEAETYAIELAIFKEKYKSTKETLEINREKWYKAKPVPKPTINAWQYYGESFKFTAPWGSEMICEYGDWIAQTIGKENDIYRIEKNAFAATYKESKSD